MLNAHDVESPGVRLDGFRADISHDGIAHFVDVEQDIVRIRPAVDEVVHQFVLDGYRIVRHTAELQNNVLAPDRTDGLIRLPVESDMRFRIIADRIHGIVRDRPNTIFRLCELR